MKASVHNKLKEKKERARRRREDEKERKRKKKRGEKGCGEDVENEFWRVRDESELWEGKNHPAI